MSARWPDFLMVGAPRCGTTSLYSALRQHPGIYMPPQKEPAFFCSDLDYGLDFGAVRFVRDEASYRRLFEPASETQLAGEACALNLFSALAAQRIRGANAQARIVIHLRDPVEQIASWHAVMVLLDMEPYSDLGRALADEHARMPAANGRPAVPAHPPITRYRAMARFGEQVERYTALFPREQIHFVVLEDFAADSRAEFRRACDFLGVDHAFAPTVPRALANRRAASARLFDAMRSKRLLRAAKAVVPLRLHARANRTALAVHRWNIRPGPRRAVDRALRDSLRAELAADVHRLSELVQRDLADLWWGSSAAR